MGWDTPWDIPWDIPLNTQWDINGMYWISNGISNEILDIQWHIPEINKDTKVALNHVCSAVPAVASVLASCSGATGWAGCSGA
jgi:hypothetical protein